MRKLLLSAAAVAMFAGSAALTPAVAEGEDGSVEVYVNVYFDKHVDVRYDKYEDTVLVFVSKGFVFAHKGAKALGVVDQLNKDNAQYLALDWSKAEIKNSVNNNTGITQLNQNSGFAPNQLNSVSFAFSKHGEVTFSTAATDQKIVGNVSVAALSLAAATIDGEGSVNANTGITQVNQNAGAMNNQGNNFALAFGKNAVVAVSEADLGQVVSNNVEIDVATHRESKIANSVQANTGITSVNQSSGNFNNQSTTISISGGLN